MNYTKDSRFLKPQRSFWIYASNGKHYLGRYQGRGDWDFVSEQPRRNMPYYSWDCSPPADVRFIAYREVDSTCFVPCRSRL
jgi:hypothetical protein